MNANIVNRNIRGEGDASKRAIINEALLRSKPNVVVLQETKTEVITQSFCRKLWNKNEVQFCYVPSQGASGGMCIMWLEDEYELLDTLEDQYTLSCMFKSRRDVTKWFVTGVYAPNDRVRRRRVWRDIASVLGVWDIPGCIVGDFDTIRFVEEKNKDITANRVNSKWEEMFPDTTQSARPRPTSDHYPLLLNTHGITVGHLPFKFEIMWMEDNSLYDLIKGWWEGYEVSGNPGYIFWKKLQLLKGDLKKWNWTHFGSTKRVMDDILANIHIIDQKDEAREATLEDRLDRINLKNDFKKWARLEALRLKSKAKDKWVDEGDNNTGYFHRCANQRRRRNFISCLVIDGVLQDDNTVIKGHIDDYYTGLYKENSSQRPFMEDVRFSSISPDENSRLERPITEEEILGTIQEMEHDKAPGPDGYPIEVFTRYWRIL
ncbi:uncharacterized protein LOC113312905 [Papaver somniferum]|uniref:uncharacterized protein LOC113312905 n=1 Tax=Papaver somniferum TaxID=3469 RepID=UPI000E6F5B67|nr:uncharacterized protein LOC113312905 [Papaver somniferum]